MRVVAIIIADAHSGTVFWGGRSLSLWKYSNKSLNIIVQHALATLTGAGVPASLPGAGTADARRERLSNCTLVCNLLLNVLAIN